MSATITVRDVMTREFVGVSEGDEVVSTAELLLAEGAECAVAMRGPEPVGLLTERDLLAWFLDEDSPTGRTDEAADTTQRSAEDPASATVGDAMSTPVRTVAAADTLDEASREMSRRGVRWLVATDDEPVGVVTAGDLVTASTLAPGVDSVADASASAVTTTESDEYSTQGVCEGCGALAGDLADLNGRLLCADCRDA